MDPTSLTILLSAIGSAFALPPLFALLYLKLGARKARDLANSLEKLSIYLEESLLQSSLDTNQVLQASLESLDRARLRYEAIEKRVLERERLCALHVPYTKLPDRSLDELIETFGYHIGAFRSRFTRVGKYLSSLIEQCDFSIERAHKRMAHALEKARLDVEFTQMQSDDLASLHRLAVDQLHLWSTRLDAAVEDDEPTPVRQIARQRVNIHLESVSFLANESRRLQVKALSANQTIYIISGIVQRLHIVKLLLSAFPPRPTEDVRLHFKLLTYSIRNILATTYNDLSALAAVEAKLERLETRALGLYIDFAKSGKQSLNATSLNNLRRTVFAVEALLEFEKQEQVERLDKWSKVEAAARLGNQELTTEVAAKRRSQAEGMLQLLDMSLEVIDTCVTHRKMQPQSS